MKSGFLTGRFKIIMLLIAAAALLLAGRFAAIMIFNTDNSLEPVLAMPNIERGPILDRNGRILAIQTSLQSVTAWTPLIKEPERTAELLAQALDMSKERILPRLSGGPGFQFIKRKASPTESRRVQGLISAGALKGISLRPESGRNYPEKNAAAHVIGYVGMDNIGLNGVEYTYNQVLSPPVVGEAIRTVYGNQVFLTLDLNIQHAVEEIARRTQTEQKATTVMILVGDARNGDILAYASAPDFDLNNFERVDQSLLRNKPISLLFEPGSVFKIFSIAAAMDRAGVRPEHSFYCPGWYEGKGPDGRTFRINCLGAHGAQNPAGILKYSCNTGAALISERFAAADFYNALRSFGFGEDTGLPLNGEEKGILRSPELWSPRSKPTMAMGQELAVTAVQVLRAATALTNKGRLLEPHIVRKIVSPEGKLVREFIPTELRQVLSPETAAGMLEMMRGVTDAGGTARLAAVEGVHLAAKTGTAQVIDPATGRYSEKAFVASCIGILPSEDPRAIVYVVIEAPQGLSYYGGRIAAPVVRETAEFLTAYLGIPRAGGGLVTHSGRVVIERRNLPEFTTKLPDLLGLSKKALLPLFSRGDLKLVIKGSGWVRRQNPAPGTPIQPGMTLTLELE
jgi:cell division protein FtsI (penicillin-binding protein 3)